LLLIRILQLSLLLLQFLLILRLHLIRDAGVVIYIGFCGIPSYDSADRLP
jgi:hypothetical protein